jgi:putative membrane protein
MFAFMTIEDLPLLNAALNSCATVLIVCGLIAVKLRSFKVHTIFMISALTVSAAFLTSYLIYHYHVGHVRFAGEGTVRTVYFTMLISHVILAVANLPMIIMTVIPALRRRFDKHRRMAKFTAPIWLYVSVTGVLVYMMCYRWYGPPLTAG